MFRLTDGSLEKLDQKCENKKSDIIEKTNEYNGSNIKINMDGT
jgi:hypothetical protein